MGTTKKQVESNGTRELAPGKATIAIVNYKTLEFTKLCLRSIRRYTKYPCEVIVVDNDSQDESVEYLRSLEWIRLLERKGCNDRTGGLAHGAGLDLALDHCQTEFFVSMHTDTFVRRPGWLEELIGCFGEKTVCVGSGKLEMRPIWQQRLREWTDYKTGLRKLLRKKDEAGKYRYYNRTICSLYRTRTLLDQGLTFSLNGEAGVTAGKQLYFDLEDDGYEMVALPPAKMSRYVWHVAHATPPVVMTKRRARTVKKMAWRVDKIMASLGAEEILQDNSLDH